MPYPDFEQSLRCLDYRRLGKQRVEAAMMIRGGWANHPASRMWRGFETALRLYANLSICIWIERGYKNTMELWPLKGQVIMPPWFGNEAFHASHRSNLLRKNPEWYGQFDWQEPDDLPYIWPVKKGKS